MPSSPPYKPKRVWAEKNPLLDGTIQVASGSGYLRKLSWLVAQTWILDRYPVEAQNRVVTGRDAAGVHC